MKYKRWTKEEDEMLLSMYGKNQLCYIAKKLNRTETSCVDRYKYLNGTCSLSYAYGLFTTTELAYALGVDNKTILNWIHKYDMPCKVLNKKKFFIDPEKFWDWLEKTPKVKINFAKYKEGTILPEPKWLQERISKDKKNTLKTGRWTTGEIKTLKFLIDNGYSNKEIAEKLHRQIWSVRNKRNYLCKKL